MFDSRIRVLGLVCCSALLLIWGRAAYLQLALGPWHRTVLSEAELRVRSIPAPRGSIRTDDATVLATDRCDADLCVYYRYLERPLDDASLTEQARTRLSRRARRNPARVEQIKQELRDEIDSMWQALAALTGTEETELDRRARLVQQRVERVVESVNRRVREHRARRAPTADPSVTAASGRSVLEWLAGHQTRQPHRSRKR